MFIRNFNSNYLHANFINTTVLDTSIISRERGHLQVAVIVLRKGFGFGPVYFSARVRSVVRYVFFFVWMDGRFLSSFFRMGDVTLFHPFVFRHSNRPFRWGN